MIVDRLSLYRAGLGPKSVCTPSRSTAKGASISLETLERHGLGLVVLPSALVITTASELPGIRRAESLSARGCRSASVGCGSRRSISERWPLAGASRHRRRLRSAADEGVERIKLLEGWSSRRFTAPGWPGDDAYVYLIDGRARVVSAWLIAAVCSSAGFLCRRRLERLSWRYLGLVVLMIASLLLDWLLPFSLCELCRRVLRRRSADLDRRAERGPGQASAVAAAAELRARWSAVRHRRRSRRRSWGCSLVRAASRSSRRSSPVVAGRCWCSFLMTKADLIRRVPRRTRFFDWRISTGFLAWRKQTIRVSRAAVRAVSAVHHIWRKTGRERCRRDRARARRLGRVALGLATAGLRGSRHRDDARRHGRHRCRSRREGRLGEVAIPRAGASCSRGPAIVRDQERGGVRDR